MVLAGFLLKLFPLFGLALFLRERAPLLWRLFAVATAVALLYLGIYWSELAYIQGATPKDWWFSYGRECFGLWLSQQVEVGRGWPAIAPWVILAWVGTAWWLRRSRPWVSPQEGEALDAFRLGSAVFLGTFLLGTNYNYRLAFLLFAVPQLLRWATKGGGGLRWLAGGALGMFLFSLWSPIGEPFLPGLQFWRDLYVVADELANWGLFGLMLLLFLHALPPWLTRWLFQPWHKTAPPEGGTAMQNPPA
jgi:hypothetical protein